MAGVSGGANETSNTTAAGIDNFRLYEVRMHARVPA